MKYLRLGGFEVFLLQEALKLYKKVTLAEDFSKNSIITKEYLENMLMQLEEKLNEMPHKKNSKVE